MKATPKTYECTKCTYRHRRSTLDFSTVYGKCKQCDNTEHFCIEPDGVALRKEQDKFTTQ